MWQSLLSLWGCVVACQCVSLLPEVIRVGYITSDIGRFEPKEEGLAILHLASEKLRKDAILPNDTLEFQFYSAFGCSYHSGPGAAVDLYKEHNVSVIFGPACTSGSEPAGKLAAYWNIPLLGHIASGEKLANKKQFPTVARSTVISKADAGLSVAFAVTYFGWKRVGFLEGSVQHAHLLADGIRAGLAHYGVKICLDYVMKNQTLELEPSLKKMKNYARIIILVFGVRPWDNREAMLAAQKLGMTSSEYVFVMAGTSFSKLLPWVGGTDSLVEDENSKAAFKQALVIEHDAFSKERTEHFNNKVANYLNKTTAIAKLRETPAFDKMQLKTSTAPYYHKPMSAKRLLNIPPYASQLFDAMYLYGLALNESFKTDTVSYIDGKTLQKYMRLRQFMGESGNVTTDNNGDRMPQYFVRAFNSEGNWETILEVDRTFDQATKKFDRVMVELQDPYWADGFTPLDVPVCGFSNELCPKDYTIVYVLCGVVAVIAVVGFIFGNRWYHSRKLEEEIFKMAWKIDRAKLVMSTNRTLSLHSFNSVQDEDPIGKPSTSQEVENDIKAGSFGLYMGSPVLVQNITKKKPVKFEKEDLHHLKAMKDMTSPNLTSFVGMDIDHPQKIMVLWMRTSRRTLQDVIMSDNFSLDFEFKMSLLSDIVKGLGYIHRSQIQYHGRLTSHTSLVDSRMVVQLSEFGLVSLFADGRLQDCVEPVETNHHMLYHVAPEYLKQSSVAGNDINTTYLGGSPFGDMFSLGMVMYQVLFRAELYQHQSDHRSPRGEQSGKMRPTIPQHDINRDLIVIMQKCWADKPHIRPSLSFVKTQFHRLMKSFSGDIVEHMMKMMERYASNLEEIVEERTSQLKEQKQKSDSLLAAMLPKSVADVLKSAGTVEPEWYQSVTIYFSDIVDFTEISAQSTPLQIVDMLNNLYSIFDKIIAHYDAYKVETIGDAYMVASGVPDRNGDKHAGEIAELALEVCQSVKSFTITHLPERSLEIRVGIHSGPVAAGVVGLTMPRYCLFGDTVNVASRMESSGVAMKTQISWSTYDMLKETGKYMFLERGPMGIKGKGTYRTYWLLGRNIVDLQPM